MILQWIYFVDTGLLHAQVCDATGGDGRIIAGNQQLL